MSKQPFSPNSQQTISIKLTESNIPSSNLIKLSQDQISFTYTISLENISIQKIPFPHIQETQSISNSIHTENFHLPKQNQTKSKKQKNPSNKAALDKDVIKRKSILRVSNIDFSTLLDNFNNSAPHEVNKTKKSITKASFSGVFIKKKNLNHEGNTSSRTNYHKSRHTLTHQPFLNFDGSSFLRTSRFFSLNNGKTAESITNLKRNDSAPKQNHKKCPNFQTDRKLNRLPIIKGSNFHLSAPASLCKKRRVFSCYQNVETSQKKVSNSREKMILVKSCRMNENDEKAKKYLQKIIQNRNSIIHYSDVKRNKFFDQYKQNLESFF